MHLLYSLHMKLHKLFDYSEPMVAASTVFIVGFFIVAIVATSIGSVTAYKIKTASDTVTVTGSARTPVLSDLAMWTIHLDAKTSGSGQQSGLDSLEAAKNKILSYLSAQKFTDADAPAAAVEATYLYPQNSEPVFTGYDIHRDIIVRSTDVDGLSALANSIAPLEGKDYTATTEGIQLTYQKLSETRVSLLSEAIKDARARAEAIAKDSGRSVGTLRNSSSGVVQVLPQGSTDVSDYGNYDTTSKKKDVTVTVHAEFELK